MEISPEERKALNEYEPKDALESLVVKVLLEEGDNRIEEMGKAIISQYVEALKNVKNNLGIK